MLGRLALGGLASLCSSQHRLDSVPLWAPAYAWLRLRLLVDSWEAIAASTVRSLVQRLHLM
jgi:hypothetical protein